MVIKFADLREPALYTVRCPLCGREVSSEELAERAWLPPAAVAMLKSRHRGWEAVKGACSACVNEALVEVLLAQGAATLHDKIEAAGPLLAHSAFGVLPTPMRLHADPRFTGCGVTLALLDSGFYPHPDLVQPRNRIRAWVDAGSDVVQGILFGPDDQPEWPGWNSAQAYQWHGMMTSAVAAGNGWLSHGLYSGIASCADVVLVKVRDARGHITNESITRGIKWLLKHGPALGVRVVSLSVAGRAVDWSAGNPVDTAVARLVEAGVTVVAAAGNEGIRKLAPPATAPEAITVGGLDDKNSFRQDEVECWHSNYGESVTGRSKPELVAPSIWVVAPVLPGSQVALEAEALFAHRHVGSEDVEFRIAEEKLVTPHYKHVEGTSFAAPIVASVVACMLEANPTLTPAAVGRILADTAQRVKGVETSRQGAGALTPALAVAQAQRVPGGSLVGIPLSPHVTGSSVDFWVHSDHAVQVYVRGSWDNWSEPGIEATQVRPCIWHAHIGRMEAGSYSYKYVLDGLYSMDDPENPRKSPDSSEGFSSVLEIPAA